MKKYIHLILSLVLGAIALITFFGHDYFNVVGEEQPAFPRNILIWVLPVAKVLFAVFIGYAFYTLLKLRKEIREQSERSRQAFKMSKEALIKSALYRNLNFDLFPEPAFVCKFKENHGHAFLELDKVGILKVRQYLERVIDNKGTIEDSDLKNLEFFIIKMPFVEK